MMRIAMKKAWLQISLVILVGSSSSLAADFKRFELQPFGGFTAGGGIPLRTDDNASHGSISVNNSYNFGVTFGVNLNELDAVEGLWRRQKTEGRLPSELAAPASLTAFDLKIDQYHCNFLHHYLVPIPRLKPYVIGGVGVTTYYAKGSRQSDSMSRFSFSLGGGVKYFFNGRFGLRGEVRWIPTLLTVSDSSFWCNIGEAGADCVIHLKTAIQSQMDVTGGIIIRF
jgi:opacity protein-like surface antigen